MNESGGVGSLGAEAVKLLQALQEWAAESAQEHAGPASEVVGGAAGLAQHVNEHIATGDQTCAYCPLCRLISAVRGTSPEVKDHLVLAASSLLQAGAALMATRSPDREPGNDRVEHIDLDVDGED